MSQKIWGCVVLVCLALMILCSGTQTGNAQGNVTETRSWIFQGTIIPSGELLDIGNTGVALRADAGQWMPSDWHPNVNAYYFNSRGENSVSLLIMVDTADGIYLHLAGKREVCLETVEILLEKIRDEILLRNEYYQDNPYFFDEIKHIKIGMLDGYELHGRNSKAKDNKLLRTHIYVAQLPYGKLLLVALYSDSINVDEATLNQFFKDVNGSLVIYLDQIPTPHPLLVTATALQQQICALTPTPTIQPTTLP